jgi:L-aminopeptidase/D-esterase-like protein
MAADAYAHAIVPTHTTNDGDTIFVMATGEEAAPVDTVGALAVLALQDAIVDAARSAEGAYGLKAACELAG